MRQPAFLQHGSSRGDFGAHKGGTHNTNEQSSPEPSSGYSSTDESPPCSVREFPEATDQRSSSSPRRRRRRNVRSWLTLSLSEALSLTMNESPPPSDGEEQTKPDIENYYWNPPAKKSPKDDDDKTTERKCKSDLGCYDLSPLSALTSHSVPTKYSSADVLEKTSQAVLFETVSASETESNPRHSDEMSDANPQSHRFTDVVQDSREQSPITRCLLGCSYIKKGATVGDDRRIPVHFRRDAVPVNSKSSSSTSMPSKVTDSETVVDLTRLVSSHEDCDDLNMTYCGDFFDSRFRKGNAGDSSKHEVPVVERRPSEEVAFQSVRTDLSNALVSNVVHLPRNLKPCVDSLDATETDFPSNSDEWSYSPATYSPDGALLELTEVDFDDQFPSIESHDIASDSTDVPDCQLGYSEEGNLAEISCEVCIPLANRIIRQAPIRRRPRHRRNPKSQCESSVVRIVSLDHGYCLKKTNRVSAKNSRKDTRHSIRVVQGLSFESDDRCKGNVSSVLARLLITRERLHPNEGSDWFLDTNIDTSDTNIDTSDTNIDISNTRNTVDERKRERPRKTLKRGHDVSNRDVFTAGDRLENISNKQTFDLDYDSYESGFQMEDVDFDNLELENLELGTFDELWNNCFDPVKFAFNSLP